MIEGDANEVPQAENQVGGVLWSGTAGSVRAARQMDADRGVRRADRGQFIMFSEVSDESSTYWQSKILFRNIKEVFWNKETKTHCLRADIFNKFLNSEMCIVTKTLHISFFSWVFYEFKI